MLPPPAPMAVTLIFGTARWYRPATLLVTVSGSPSMIMPTSKLVPPMSAVMTLGYPSFPARAAEASTPPAGPDVSISTARRPACSASITPPAESITVKSPPNPLVRRRRSSSSTYRLMTGPR